MGARLCLLGILKKYQPSDSWKIRPGNKSVELLLKEAGMDSHMGYILLVNGSRKKKDYVPQEGDEIKVLPLLTGG